MVEAIINQINTGAITREEVREMMWEARMSMDFQYSEWYYEALKATI